MGTFINTAGKLFHVRIATLATYIVLFAKSLQFASLQHKVTVQEMTESQNMSCCYEQEVTVHSDV